MVSEVPAALERTDAPAFTDPAELRAALARSGMKAYVLAARIGINPRSVSRMLRGHQHIRPDVGARILHECTKATRTPRVPTPANG